MTLLAILLRADRVITLEAIRAFSGSDAKGAVVPPVAQAMMVEFDRRAVHYEIAFDFEGE